MAAGEHRPGQVLDSYLLRSLAVAGYAPSFEHCARCGPPRGPHRWFNPSMGGVLCATCRVPGSASPAPETVALLGALLAGDWPVVDAAEPRHLKEASGLVAAYLAWHLERGLRSLAYVERYEAAVKRQPCGAPSPHPSGRHARRRSRRTWCPRHVAIVMDGNGRWAKRARAAAHGGPRAGRALALRRRRGRRSRSA